MKRAEKKQVAFDLFMNTDKSQKEIADLVGCNEKTLSQWKSKENWEELKSAQTLTAVKIIRQIYKRLDDLTQEGSQLDADKIIKLANSIEKLSDRNATISQTINVFKDFISWMMEKEPELAKKVNEFQKLYINSKING
jgi:uncharacterized protein YjcR